MRLSAGERAKRDEVIAKAHAEHGRDGTRAVALAVVDEFTDMEGFGQAWVTDYLHHLAVAGAMAVCRQHRRRFTIPALTKRGKRVNLPAFTGAKAVESLTSAELDAPQADLPLEEFGLTFAAVVDGKIVGTVGEGPWTANPFVWTDSDAAYSMDLTYLNPENAMTYCDGYGPNDDADLYLIAGTVTINAGGSTTTPIYSWKQVTPAP